VIPQKIAQSLMYRHFATMCCRITPFLPECLEINCKNIAEILQNGQIVNIVIRLAVGKGTT